MPHARDLAVALEDLEAADKAEEDAEGRSPEEQYESSRLLDMTEKKKNEKETARKKRKAESKTDEKNGTKKRKTRRG